MVTLREDPENCLISKRASPGPLTIYTIIYIQIVMNAYENYYKHSD